MNPTTVPASARHAVAPVDAALVRSTDSVPSTTQNPCCTPERSATATAAASASAPRKLLRNHTERRLACLRTTTVAPARPTRGVWARLTVPRPCAQARRSGYGGRRSVRRRRSGRLAAGSLPGQPGRTTGGARRRSFRVGAAARDQRVGGGAASDDRDGLRVHGVRGRYARVRFARAAGEVAQVRRRRRRGPSRARRSPGPRPRPDSSAWVSAEEVRRDAAAARGRPGRPASGRCARRTRR